MEKVGEGCRNEGGGGKGLTGKKAVVGDVERTIKQLIQQCLKCLKCLKIPKWVESERLL